MKTLPIYSVKERRPENGETVLMILKRPLRAGEAYIDVKFEEVQYFWAELDGGGYPTGNSLAFDKDIHNPDNPPEGCKFMMSISNGILGPNSLYARGSDMNKLYET